MAVVYDPYRDELFTATAEQRSALNNVPLEVSPTTDVAEVVIAAGSPPDPKSLAPSLRAINALSPQVSE